MTPLRHKMIESMRQRGFSVRTQQSYISSVAALARHHRCSPDRLEPDDVAAYFRHLVLERSLSPASCLVHLHGIRFFYLKVLARALRCRGGDPEARAAHSAVAHACGGGTHSGLV